MLKKFSKEKTLEIGIDEAGRGCLFGPVCVSAVSLKNFEDPLINNIKDSKKLSEKKKNILYDFIIKNSFYSIELIDDETIDKENILQATLIGMHKCLDNLDNNIKIENILVDGNHFNTYYSKSQDEFIKHECITGGDNEYLNIAAASILAKVSRDRYIIDLCEKDEILKRYDLHNNKGYGTKKHMEAIKEYGIVEGHRKSFKPCCSYV